MCSYHEKVTATKSKVRICKLNMRIRKMSSKTDCSAKSHLCHCHQLSFIFKNRSDVSTVSNTRCCGFHNHCRYHVNYPREMNIRFTKSDEMCMQLNHVQLYWIFNVAWRLIPTEISKFMHSWAGYCVRKGTRLCLNQVFWLCLCRHTHFRFHITVISHC